jgi:hypothetical protein
LPDAPIRCPRATRGSCPDTTPGVNIPRSSSGRSSPPGRARVGVDQHRIRDPIVLDERRAIDGPVPIATTLGTGALHLGICVAQLRGVLAAQQSPEVAQEHERHAPLAPVVAEAVRGAGGSGSESAESAARSTI